MSTRLQILARPLLFKRRGKLTAAPAIAATAPHNENRLIDAEAIHGDEQAFWQEKRWFYYGKRGEYMPTWDRMAQTLILMTRTVPRVPQEAAFRIFAVFLKLLMITRITDVASMMLPLWSTMNVQGLIQQAKKDVAEAEEKKGSEKTSTQDAAPVTPPVADGPK